MGTQELNNIKRIFSQWDVFPEYIEHEVVNTSEEATKVSGCELKQGIKAIVFTNGKGEFAIVNVSADKRIDQKLVAVANNWSKSSIRIATPEEVLEQTGCDVGSVSPIGHKSSVRVFYDSTIFRNSTNFFSIGIKTNSVKINSSELEKVFRELGLTKGNFVKE
jgi:prolyl-tRNA editing enzyme YbaK/EbsC (Cys-tRNA(Pro) deacylase)